MKIQVLNRLVEFSDKEIEFFAEYGFDMAPGLINCALISNGYKELPEECHDICIKSIADYILDVYNITDVMKKEGLL